MNEQKLEIAKLATQLTIALLQNDKSRDNYLNALNLDPRTPNPMLLFDLIAKHIQDFATSQERSTPSE